MFEKNNTYTANGVTYYNSFLAGLVCWQRQSQLFFLLMTTSPKNKKHIARTWQSQSLNKTVSMSHQPNTEFFEDALEVIIMSITSEKHGREQRIEKRCQWQRQWQIKDLRYEFELMDPSCSWKSNKIGVFEKTVLQNPVIYVDKIHHFRSFFIGGIWGHIPFSDRPQDCWFPWKTGCGSATGDRPELKNGR